MLFGAVTGGKVFGEKSRHEEALITVGTIVWVLFRVNGDDVVPQTGTLVELGTTPVAVVRLLTCVSQDVTLQVRLGLKRLAAVRTVELAS